MGTIYASLGLYEKAVDLFHNSLQRDPASATTSGNLAISLMGLGRYDEAGTVLEEARKKGTQTNYLVQVNYWRAFLRNDTEQMSSLLALSTGVPGAHSQANTEAYFGRFEKARLLSLAAANQMEVDGQTEATSGLSARNRGNDLNGTRAPVYSGVSDSFAVGRPHVGDPTQEPSDLAAATLTDLFRRNA